MDATLKITAGVDIAPLERGIVKAEKSIKELEQATKPLKISSDRAGQSIFNLGRVASDAPFGFIAIQNNIEPLVQSLQQLGKESGGVGGALKALGSSLLGPTGLLLGFSLVSSAITVAVQKYGSLGAAIDALTANNTQLAAETAKAAKSYEKFNEELRTSQQIVAEETAGAAGQLAKIDALVRIVQDQTKSYLERNNALNDLKKISKDYFGNLDIEKGKVTGLTTAVTAYKDAIIQSAIIKGFEQQIGATNVQLSEQQTLLAKLKDQLATAKAAPQRIVGLAATVDTRDIVAATDAVRKQEQVVNALLRRTTDLNTEIGKSIDRYNQITAPINAAAESTKNLADANNKVTRSLGQTRTAKPVVKVAVVPDAAKLGVSNEQADRDINNAFKLANPVVQVPIVPTIPAAALATFDAFKAKIKDTFSAEQLNTLAATLNGIVAPAVDAVFGALENGQNVFQALGGALKRLIIQLVATIAKAAILAGVLTLISGGTAAGAASFGSLFKGLLGGGGGAGIGSLFQLGRSSAPTFGGGNMGQGGMQLSGQVVFVQRGPDLVGVLNNTNSRIGRVG
jgi:hypothetical protein